MNHHCLFLIWVPIFPHWATTNQAKFHILLMARLVRVNRASLTLVTPQQVKIIALIHTLLCTRWMPLALLSLQQNVCPEPQYPYELI